MVERIGNANSLAREALRAAQKVVPERSALAGLADQVGEVRPATSSAEPAAPQGLDFGRVMEAGLGEVDQRVQAAEALPEDLLIGRVSDFHAIAVQLKTSELSFRFAMEIRNKLVDAYREIMRMSV